MSKLLKRIEELEKEIELFKEKDLLMQKEFEALQITIFQKTQELDEQRNLTFQASKMSALGEMAGGIAHEINNPLTIISTTNRKMRRLAEEGITDPAVYSKCFDSIDHTVSRITRIINGLKTVSRDSTNENLRHVKLIEIFEDVLALCREKFKDKGVYLHIDLKDSVYQTNIFCRRVQLSQVFWNMLENSYDAIENLDEKWIEIDCKLEGKQLTLRFTDSGPGIPKNIEDKIFQPFFTTKEVGKGTGLGISLSHAIIKNHGGNLYLDKKSKNTSFVVTLPISDAT